MLKASSLIVPCALVLACGGQAAPPKAPQPVASAVAAPVAPAMRRPSPDVARYWKLPAPQPIAAYADLGSLLRTELMSGLVPELLQLLQGELKGSERACLSVLTERAGELLLGGDEEHGLIVLSLGAEGVKAVRTACVGSVLPVERAAVAGSNEAYLLGEHGVLAFEPGVLLLGRKPFVEAALAASAKPTALPASLALTAEQHVAFDVTSGGVHAVGQLVASNDRFGVDARVELPSEELAQRIEERIEPSRKQAYAMVEQQPNGAQLRKLLDSVRIVRKGKAFDVSFETRGTASEQAHDIGVLAGLGFHGARRYTQQAKTAEARNVLAQIGLSYGRSLQAEPKRPKKLVSLPAVPATVPRGVAYQSSPEDWKAWAPIAFSLSAAHRYQYEVVAAKDGKSAELRARGDLDGDGKASLFSLKIALDPKTGLLTARDLDETEPLE
jgi:hypothetical protein